MHEKGKDTLSECSECSTVVVQAAVGFDVRVSVCLFAGRLGQTYGRKTSVFPPSMFPVAEVTSRHVTSPHPHPPPHKYYYANTDARSTRHTSLSATLIHGCSAGNLHPFVTTNVFWNRQHSPVRQTLRGEDWVLFRKHSQHPRRDLYPTGTSLQHRR